MEANMLSIKMRAINPLQVRTHMEVHGKMSNDFLKYYIIYRPILLDNSAAMANGLGGRVLGVDKNCNCICTIETQSLIHAFALSACV